MNTLARRGSTLLIRQVAEAQGLTVCTLARKAAVSERTVRKIWQDARASIYLGTLDKLAKGLGVSPVELVHTDTEEDEGQA